MEIDNLTKARLDRIAMKDSPRLMSRGAEVFSLPTIRRMLLDAYLQGQKDANPLEVLTPLDPLNLDHRCGTTAERLDWPRDLSNKANTYIAYLGDTAFLFKYQGRFIVTDESLFLTEAPDNSNGPIGEFETIDKMADWLEDGYKSLLSEPE